MKAIDRILFLTYGNHSAIGEKREEARIVLNYLNSSELVSQEHLMEELGYNPDSDNEQKQFFRLVAPLKGSKSGNPLSVGVVASERTAGRTDYRLSKDMFDGSMGVVRSDVLDLMEREMPYERGEGRIIDKINWLAFANHGQTGKHREDARTLITYLLKHGEEKKQELMRMIGLSPNRESHDTRWKRKMQWLTGNWEKEPKSPLHIDNHGFLLRRRMDGQTAYYSLSPDEFRRSSNTWMKNIRDFLR